MIDETLSAGRQSSPDAPSILEVQEVKRRSVSGVLALVSRTFIIQIISFVATLALTIFLDPNTYGVFYLLAYFSDVGLAAALIQKKEGITKEDLSTTFTVQQLLVVTLLFLLFILSPIIRTQYHIDQTGVYLLYAMGVSLFLSSLKTIPSIMLEREIKFSGGCLFCLARIWGYLIYSCCSRTGDRGTYCHVCSLSVETKLWHQ
ncbi:MAG: Polysaccharide biosynthesis protein [Candidatus Collierbacteria bacterium GW2011_GWC2_44_30]|nr:MAG: Polysaccharide biosynthesis protein [Candidatus Collierbacteria bacterium GW2011_GWC2_44_30]